MPGVIDYNIDFQLAILALMIRDRSFLSDYGYDIIKPEIFENFYLSTICNFIVTYFVKYGSAPTQAVLTAQVQDYCNTMKFSDEILSNYNSFVSRICTDDFGDLDFVKEKVLSWVRRQSFREGIKESHKLLEEGKYEEALQHMLKKMMIGHNVGSGSSLKSKIDTFPEEYRRLFGREAVIGSGFPSLDICLNGGFGKRRLYVFLAHPKGGKTTMLVNLACNFLRQGLPVMYYTCEMEETEILFKIFSNLSLMTHEEIINPLNDQRFRKELEEFKKYSADIRVKFFNGGTISTNAIKSHLSKLKITTGFSPEVVIVDYADYLIPTVGLKDFMYDDLGNVYQDLINLGDYFDVPVITASQPKVGAWEKEFLGIGDMSGSSKKEALLYALISINQNSEDRNKNPEEFKLYVSAVRMGLSDKVIYCKWDKDKNYMQEIEEKNILIRRLEK